MQQLIICQASKAWVSCLVLVFHPCYDAPCPLTKWLVSYLSSRSTLVHLPLCKKISPAKAVHQARSAKTQANKIFSGIKLASIAVKPSLIRGAASKFTALHPEKKSFTVGVFGTYRLQKFFLFQWRVSRLSHGAIVLEKARASAACMRSTCALCRTSLHWTTHCKTLGKGPRDNLLFLIRTECRTATFPHLDQPTHCAAVESPSDSC